MSMVLCRGVEAAAFSIASDTTSRASASTASEIILYNFMS